MFCRYQLSMSFLEPWLTAGFYKLSKMEGITGEGVNHAYAGKICPIIDMYIMSMMYVSVDSKFNDMLRTMNAYSALSILLSAIAAMFV